VTDELPPVTDELPEPRPEPKPGRHLYFSEQRGAAGQPDAADEWNLWELERRAREHAGGHGIREEWAAIFMYLREFAKSDGRLPASFDSLVRESFPELTRAA
jgi:hypothetical protein